jgi:hypothetical protein
MSMSKARTQPSMAVAGIGMLTTLPISRLSFAGCSGNKPGPVREAPWRKDTYQEACVYGFPMRMPNGHSR